MPETDKLFPRLRSAGCATYRGQAPGFSTLRDCHAALELLAGLLGEEAAGMHCERDEGDGTRDEAANEQPESVHKICDDGEFFRHDHLVSDGHVAEDG